MNIRTIKYVFCLLSTFVVGAEVMAFDHEQELVISKYRGSSELVGFPVLVRISPARIPDFAYSQFQLANGGDLSFVTDKGVECPHEIESWNESGESLVWVRVPVLKVAQTKLIMRWGDSAATPPTTSRNVWDGAAGGFYAGVWHFGETITSETASSTPSSDSAKYSSDIDMKAEPVQYGGKVFTSEMVSTNGVVGNARVNQTTKTGYFNNSGGNSLRVDSYDAMNVGTTFTVSGWFRVYDIDTYPGFVTRGTSYATNDGWAFVGYNSDNLNYVAWLMNHTGTKSSYPFNTGTFADHWTHVVAVYDDTKFTLYVDGNLRAENSAIDSFGDNGKKLVFGLWYSALDGAYDEIRLHSDVLSKDWIQAEYDTVSVSDFVSVPVVAACYVSGSRGSDQTGDGTKELPWATIGHAVVSAAAGDEIRIEGGVYSESVAMTVSAGAPENLTLRGGYGSDWKQDLSLFRTVVKPSGAAQPCVLVDGVHQVTLRGLTLTGGNYGLQTQNECNTLVVEQLIVTNCTAGGLQISGDGAVAGVHQRICNSYIASNAGVGLEEKTQSSAVGSTCEIINSTIVGNAGGLKGNIARFRLYNSIVGEQASGVGIVVGSGNVETYDSCVWNATRAAYDCFVSASWDYYMYYQNPQILPCVGSMRENPLLSAGGSLQEGSPCIRRGRDSALDLMIEQRDVMGRAWGETPDMGCFMHAVEVIPETMQANIYVAADGNDMNAGTSPEAPLRTVALGARRTAPGGTLHVGAGSFLGPVVLDKPGMRLVGAGGDQTEIRSPESHEAAVVICATGVVFRCAAAAGGFIGVQQVGDGTGVEVSDAVIRNNVRGFSSSRFSESSSSGTLRLHYAIVTNNAAFGVQFYYNSVVADNLLIARNGRNEYSAGVASGDLVSSQPVWLYNCPIADNVGKGIYTGRSYGSGLTHERNFINCIVSGNTDYGYHSYDVGVYGNFLNCLVNGNGTDFGRTPETNVNGIDKPVCFDSRVDRLYRLTRNSPAVCAGINVNTMEESVVTYSDDLIHERRRNWDLGCYAYNQKGFAVIVR